MTHSVQWILLRSYFWEQSFCLPGSVYGTSGKCPKLKSDLEPRLHPHSLLEKKCVSCFKNHLVQVSEYLQKTRALITVLEERSKAAVNILHLQKQCNYHWLITSVYEGRRIMKESCWRESRWWLRREGCMCVTQKSKDYIKLESCVYGCCEIFILIFLLLTNWLGVKLVSAIIVDKKASQENVNV